MAQELFFNIFFEKDPHLNAIELLLKTDEKISLDMLREGTKAKIPEYFVFNLLQCW